MTTGRKGIRKALVLTGLLLITATSQAVLAQSEGHSSMEVDFGLLESDGSCGTASNIFVFDGSESVQRCLLIEFQATSNSRFNLSVRSDLSGAVLETIELIASPRTSSSLIIPLSLVIPQDMSYGEHQLEVSVEDWNPMSGEPPEPMVNADGHILEIQRPGSEIIGDFRFPSQEIEIPQSAKLTGVMSHSIDGSASITVRPVLLQSSSAITTLEPYSIRPGVSVHRSVSFQLPDSLEPGTHTLIVALQDNRENDTLLWFEQLEVTINEPSGSVNVPYANWDIPSFRGPSVLGTYPEDVVGVQLNLTNPGSRPASSDLWINFATGTDCFPVFLGEIWIGAGESRTTSLQTTIPQVPVGTALDAKLMSSGDCSGEAIQQLEQITVFDWPASVSSSVQISRTPSKLDGSSTVPISFNVRNLENRATSNLEAEVTLFALGLELGRWVGPLALEANKTETFHREVSLDFCYDGDVDAAIKIRNGYGEVIDSSMTQRALRTYFIEGGFDLHSSLVGSQTVSLGMPIKIRTRIEAQTSNPSGCTLLIPLMTMFEPTEGDIPSETEISLIEVESGGETQYDLETTISHLSGKYEVSQHLIRAYTNETSDNWLESELRFAEIVITPINPNFSSFCEDDVFLKPNLSTHYLWVSCQIDNLAPVPAWVKIGTEIGDEFEWSVPVRLDPSDGKLIEFSRVFSAGSDYSASLYIKALWDGEWIDVGDTHEITLPTENALDGFEPFPNERATTSPDFPRGGEPFAIQFRVQGSTNWLDGTYEVKLWLDESKQGAVYSIPAQKHNLQVGEFRLIEIGLKEWPKNCGRLPYEVVARDSDGQVKDTIESYFDGCEIELADLSLVGQIEISQSPTTCFATIIVENIGSRDYAPDTSEEQADVTLIIDGIVEKSSTTVPPLDIGEKAILEVGITKSGFREIHIILNGDGRFSELDRSNNGLGWSSASGPILFENDSDFDGLSNEIEASGYWIRTLEDRTTVEQFLVWVRDRDNGPMPYMNEKMVFPSPEHHDSDYDGLSDLLEWSIRSDPNNADTDGDGYGDLEEYQTPNQDPLIMETNKPIIHSSETLETRHPIESESKSGLFTKIHTREFTVEDRNLAMVTVTIVRPGISSITIPSEHHETEGDRHYYSVSYEYSSLEVFYVNVTAIDSFGNGVVFSIASQESVWDRASNTISSFATNSLLSKFKIDAPVLGFLTGMVYGLKDIVDFATGVISFILNFWELLGVVWGIIEDCAPRPQLPLRVPSECPIDLSVIWNSMVDSFFALSPYEKGTPDNAIFLMFAMWGWAIIALLTNSFVSKAWGAAKSSSATINSIAETLSGATVAVIGTLGRAVSSAKGALSSGVAMLGIPGVIISAVSSSLSGIYSLGSHALKKVIGAVFLTVFLVPILILAFDDVLKLVWRGVVKAAEGKMSLLTIADHRFYRIITHKNVVMKEFPDNTFDELLDEWAVTFSPGDRTGKWYEFSVNRKTGSVQIDLKNPPILREIDGVNCKNGCIFIEAKAGNQAEYPYRLMFEDGKSKTKSGVARWDGGDTIDLRPMCSPLTIKECTHALMKRGHPEFGSGLSEDSVARIKDGIRLRGESGFSDLVQARKQAEILKDSSRTNKVTYSIEGFSPTLPCAETRKCVDYANKVRTEYGIDSMTNFMEMVDRSGDFAGSSYGLLTSNSFFAMSGEIGFVEEDSGYSEKSWLATSIVVFVIFSYIYFRKSRSKTSLTSVL